ncbi:MAG: nucleoside monophosphate kinase [Candidatus Gribaldobacteria bacterium]|nr:nucleoside monophosphate kinase [Candidatus Gribaldobacteria bacterium]
MVENKPKLVVALIGPPGSGKGTQGMLLAEKLGLYYFETSKILEGKFKEATDDEFVEVNSQKFFIKDEHQLWLDGILCSPPFVSYLVQEKIKGLHQKGENLLLSGSPRTLHEAQEIMPFLAGLYGAGNIKIVFLDISAQETIFRNSNRRICDLMRHPILYNEETKDLTKCAFDGSDLVKRKGLDDPETIKIRLTQFEERTMPILKYCEENGYKVSKVNGEGSVAKVFERIIKSLS